MTILRLTRGATVRSRPAGILAQVAWGIAAAVALVAAALLSVAVLAVALVAGAAVWGSVLWKTRKLRRALREQAEGDAVPPHGAMGPGRVIEGEAVSVPDEGR